MTSPGQPSFRRAIFLWLLAAALAATAAGTAAAQSPAPAAAVTTQPAPEPPPAAVAATPAVPAAPAAATAPAAAAASSAPAASALFPPQPAPKRGLLNNLGDWWRHPFAAFNSEMKDARSKFDDLNKKSNDAAKNAAAATQAAVKSAAEATKDAAAAIVRLPSARVIDVRQRCATAANGAPDCQAAATAACRAKGFTSGESLDIRSSQACPPAVLLSGRTPAEGECPEETVMLRAICQ